MLGSWKGRRQVAAHEALKGGSHEAQDSALGSKSLETESRALGPPRRRPHGVTGEL